MECGKADEDEERIVDTIITHLAEAAVEGPAASVLMFDELILVRAASVDRVERSRREGEEAGGWVRGWVCGLCRVIREYARSRVDVMRG